jgi:Uma2 family endonuclease
MRGLGERPGVSPTCGELPVAVAAEYRVNFDDFCALVHEGQKADLIDGVIYMASPDNIEHHDLLAWFIRLLGDFVDEMKLGGRFFSSRIAFRLDDENSPEPDLAYVKRKRLHLVRKTRINGAPDWALEIVSPESIDRDCKKKRRLYERFKVREYWILNPMEQRLTCLRLSRAGKYEEIRPRSGCIFSNVIAGFFVRPAWLWQSPLPRPADVLAQILEFAKKRKGNGHVAP